MNTNEQNESQDTELISGQGLPRIVLLFGSEHGMPMPRSSARSPTLALLGEDLLLLCDAARQYKFMGTAARLRHMILYGRRNPFTGKRVYLEYAIIPGGTATSWPAMQRFLAALNAQPTRKKLKRRRKKP